METGVLVCFFKPTRFACGETRRIYRQPQAAATSRRVSSRVPSTSSTGLPCELGWSHAPRLVSFAKHLASYKNVVKRIIMFV
jgi:hypothetical protein